MNAKHPESRCPLAPQRSMVSPVAAVELLGQSKAEVVVTERCLLLLKIKIVPRCSGPESSRISHRSESLPGCLALVGVGMSGARAGARWEVRPSGKAGLRAGWGLRRVNSLCLITREDVGSGTGSWGRDRERGGAERERERYQGER